MQLLSAVFVVIWKQLVNIGCGYEILIKWTTELSAQGLKDCCIEKQNHSLLLAGLAGEDVKRFVAYKLHYHQSCYPECTKKRKAYYGGWKCESGIFNYVRIKKWSHLQ